MRKIWKIIDDDAAAVSKLAAEVGISELTAKILVHRGITAAGDAEKFLNPETAQEFYDPFTMRGMDEAVDRILAAIDDGEKICVYGDYDVDGMAGTALLTRALINFGGDVMTYIPDRVEGYGMNIPALEKIVKAGAKLLISVDCGISNWKEIAAVADRMDVIVTDHHLPALEEVQDAVAILDPHLEGCPYAEKNLCGAGVAFKIAQALAQELEGVEFSEYTIDIELAALATVADLVPLTGENRKIVRIGLEKMRDTKCIGLAALVNVSGFAGKKITASNVAYQIAPRLNSIGRLESAKRGLELLLTEDAVEAGKIAFHLEEMNVERKRIEKKNFTQAVDKVQVLNNKQGGDLWTLTVGDESWNPGLIGLTASRLVEKYTLPAIVISVGKNISRGSCRSIPSLHMKNALDSMAELFDNYGGHRQAAGFSIPTKSIPEFQRRFDEYVRAHLTDEDFPPVVEIDALINPTQITLAMAEEFGKLEPCGIGNPEPILACRNVTCGEAKTIGSDRAHLSFVIRAADESKNVKAIAFGAAKFMGVVNSAPVDIIFQPSIDYWQGERYVKCFVSEITPSVSTEKIQLTRELLADVYKFLKARRRENPAFDLYTLTAKFSENFPVSAMLDAVNIFRELGLIKINDEARTFEMPACGKRSLENSRTFRLNGK